MFAELPGTCYCHALRPLFSSPPPFAREWLRDLHIDVYDIHAQRICHVSSSRRDEEGLIGRRNTGEGHDAIE